MRLKRRLLALYSAVLLLLCSIIYVTFDNIIQTAMVWFILFSFWLIGYQVFYCISGEERKKCLQNSRNIFQVLWILLPVSFWGFSAVVNKASSMSISLWSVLPWILIWICLGILILYGTRFCSWNVKKIGTYLIDHKFGIGMVLFSLAIRMPMLSTLQRWDAGEYYSGLIDACENYDFSLQSLFDYFRLCGHTNFGFSLPLAVGEFWNPAGMTGALIVNLILTLGAIYTIYLLIKDCWLKCSDGTAAGLGLTVSVTPLFLGTSAYLNPDYLLAIWFVFLLYADYRKYYLMSWFFAVLLSQSKETGIVVFLGYYGARLLYEFIHEKKDMLKIPAFWLLLLTGCVYAYTIFRIGALTSWGLFQSDQAVSTWNLFHLLLLIVVCVAAVVVIYAVRRLYQTQKIWFQRIFLGVFLILAICLTGFVWRYGDTEGFNCFGISAKYILFKLKQYFVLNFSWVVSACAVAAFLRLIYQKVRHGKKYAFDQFLSFAGGVTAFLLFGFFYIVAGITRYNVVLAICWSLIGILGLYAVWNLKKYKALSFLYIVFWLALFLPQSFHNVDPVSQTVFEELATDEENSMVYVDYEPFFSPYYGDSLVTNYQYAWIDRAIDQFLAEINYETDMRILLPRKESFGLFPNGNGSAYSLVWNSQLQRRTFKTGDPNEVSITILMQDDFLGTIPERIVKSPEYAEGLPEELYIPVLFYYDPDLESLWNVLEHYYYLSEAGEIRCGGGKLTYYHAVRKETFYDYQIDELLQLGGEEIMLDDYSWLSEDIFDKACDWIEEEKRKYIGEAIVSERKFLNDPGLEETVVREGDWIEASLWIQTEEGEYLDENYTGSYNSRDIRMLLGYNRYLEEVEETLIGTRLNETVTIRCRIPEEYVPAGAYAGTELTLYIMPTKISKRISDNNKETERLSLLLSDEWVHKKLSLAAGEIALDYDYHSFGFSDNDFAMEHDEVKKEIETYCASLGISEIEYVENYLQITYEEYGEFLNRVAMTVLKKMAILEELTNYYEKRISY